MTEITDCAQHKLTCNENTVTSTMKHRSWSDTHTTDMRKGQLTQTKSGNGIPSHTGSGNGTNLGEMFGGHFWEDAIKVSLVNQSDMEHPLTLMAVEKKDLVVLTDHTWVGLKHTWSGMRYSKFKVHSSVVHMTLDIGLQGILSQIVFQKQ